MARHENDFAAGAEAPLSMEELLTLLASGSSADQRSREEAIACVLSGGEGWREAVALLGGAFAGTEPGLRMRKGD